MPAPSGIDCSEGNFRAKIQKPLERIFPLLFHSPYNVMDNTVCYCFQFSPYRRAAPHK